MHVYMFRKALLSVSVKRSAEKELYKSCRTPAVYQDMLDFIHVHICRPATVTVTSSAGCYGDSRKEIVPCWSTFSHSIGTYAERNTILPYATVTKVVVCCSIVTSISYKCEINSAKSFKVIDAS